MIFIVICLCIMFKIVYRNTTIVVSPARRLAYEENRFFISPKDLNKTMTYIPLIYSKKQILGTMSPSW